MSALLFLLVSCLLFSAPAAAGSKRNNKTQAAKKTQSRKKKTTRHGWVRSRNRYYYYRGNKPVKGWQRIDGRTYYFNRTGVQLTSWRKIGTGYYCFGADGGPDGYLLTSTKKNGIWTGTDGRAQGLSGRAGRKVKVMAGMSAYMDRIVGNALSRKQRLKKCYDYLRRKVPYRSFTHFRKTDKNRDLWYAEQILDRDYADCHVYASAFAYLANAVGYDQVTLISALEHSWVRINGKYYDVSIGRFSPYSYHLYGMKSYKGMIRKYHYKVKAKVDLSKL